MNELEFIDIEVAIPTVQVSDTSNGQTSLDNLATMQIGFGEKAFHADASGIWLGAVKFNDAPLRADMTGNLHLENADITLSKNGIPYIFIGDI
jgi:hypothetical protein